MTELLFYSRSKKDGSFTVPDTVETICDYAFSGNQYLEEIILSERTITLGQYTFSNCNLTKAELPYSLEKIGSHCFDLNPKISLPKRRAGLFPHWKIFLTRVRRSLKTELFASQEKKRSCHRAVSLAMFFLDSTCVAVFSPQSSIS